MIPNNPFAILRLPANATAGEIKSAGQMAVARLRLSDAGNTFAIRSAESAIEQLRDPVIRFKMGLEWPSLGPLAAKRLATDDAFANITSTRGQDRSAAVAQLVQGESLISKQHIWSVFLLMRAEEFFGRALSPQKSPADLDAAAIVVRVSEFFAKALGLWVSATDSREFWLAQRLRANVIDDPRVGSDLCAECEADSLHIAVESFAELASEALQLRNAAVCTAIIGGIKLCGAKQSNIDRVLAEIYKPICGRTVTTIDALNARLKSTKSKSIGAYRDLHSEYLRDIHADIKLMLIVGDLPGTAEERCRDAAASFLRNLSVEAANNANAFELATECNQLAHEAADSEHLKSTLAIESKTIQTIAESSQRAERLKPQIEALQTALKADDFERALVLIDHLITADPENASELRNIRIGVALRAILAEKRQPTIPPFGGLARMSAQHANPPCLEKQLELLKRGEAEEAVRDRGCLIPLVVGATLVAGGGGALIGFAVLQGASSCLVFCE